MADDLPPLPEPINLTRDEMRTLCAASKIVRNASFKACVGIFIWACWFALGAAAFISGLSEHSLVLLPLSGLNLLMCMLTCHSNLIPFCRTAFGIVDAAERGKPFLYRDQETLRVVEAFRVYRSVEAYNALQAEYIAARAAIQDGTRPPFFDDDRLRTALYELGLACLDAHIKLLRACISPGPLPSHPYVLPPLPKPVTLAVFEARVCDLN